MFGYGYKHTTIENVKNEIKLVDEKYRDTHSFANSDDEYSLLIDVKEFLDVLKPNEVSPNEVVEIPTDDDDEFEEITFQDWLYEYSDLDRLRCHNSYNWTSPLSHDINFEVYGYDENSTVFIVIRVHKFGDIRGNYTDEIIVKYDSYESFLCHTMDYATKEVSFYFDYNNKEYCASIRTDWYRDDTDVIIYDKNLDEIILEEYNVYLQGENKQELIEEMQQLMIENL